VKKVIGVVVVIALAVGLKFYNRGADDKQVLADMKEILSDLELSAEDSAYVNGILEAEHKRAFEAAYSMGGRRRAAKLDEDKYIDAVFEGMIARCNADRKAELADTLRGAHLILRSTGEE